MLSREVLSCVNRLRKAANLYSGDRVRVFYDADATKSEKDRSLTMQAIQADLAVLSSKLSAPVHESKNRQSHMQALAEEKLDVFGYQMSVSITAESVSFVDDATLAKLFVGANGSAVQRSVEALKCYIGNLTYASLSFDAPLSVTVDGVSVQLVPGTHFFVYSC
jgi:hypothetical protein